MRILLDECVPIQVCGALPGHEVTSAQRMGWGGLRNGALLDATEQAGFDLFIVAEKNLRHQQNLTGRRLAILELWTNHRPNLERHFERINVRLEQTGPGHYEAKFPTKDVGSYLLNLVELRDGKLTGSQRVGASVNYSPEFNAPEPNLPLLRRLAEAGGGQFLPPGPLLTAAIPAAQNPFLHDRRDTFQPLDW